jgi:hypothetical protein
LQHPEHSPAYAPTHTYNPSLPTSTTLTLPHPHALLLPTQLLKHLRRNRLVALILAIHLLVALALGLVLLLLDLDLLTLLLILILVLSLIVLGFLLKEGFLLTLDALALCPGASLLALALFEGFLFVFFVLELL